MIRVGKFKSDKSVLWIGFDAKDASKPKTPLTEEELHVYTLSEDDAVWLIDALQKEVRRIRRTK